MSIFYNRDSNISGVTEISSLTFNPSYGSRVTFTSNVNQYETDNGYYNLIPMSINSLRAKFDLKYDLNELEAQRLVNFIEKKNGVYDITFTDPSLFYKSIDGFCNEYAINHINKNHYEVAISLEVKEAPNLFNWSGMAFVKTTFNNWATSQPYQKYGIVYSNTNSNKLNNYYYCNENHTSSSALTDGPTGSSSKWSQNFFFETDVGFQNTVNLKLSELNFRNSFSQSIKTKKNIAALNLTYKFSNITTQKAKAILHFLENKGGYRRFRVNMDSVYNRPKVFYSPSWTHTWKYENSHDIEVQLIEDPLGVIPKNS